MWKNFKNFKSITYLTFLHIVKSSENDSDLFRKVRRYGFLLIQIIQSFCLGRFISKLILMKNKKKSNFVIFQNW
ncbi:hypothetical protein BWK59_10890, partial [Flavobacterium davisii]